MSRRKELKLKLNDLSYSDRILKLMQSDPKFEGFDLRTVQIKVLGNITPKISDARHAYESLRNFMTANPNCVEYYEDEALVGKVRIAKMMRVNRSTFDKWLRDGLIVPKKSKYIYDTDIYDPTDILEQLKKHI